MPVSIRLFAALRDAAGTGQAQADPGDLQDVLQQLRERFGDRFAARLDVAAVLVDGEPVPADGHRPVRDGSEVALLPPFAGGADQVPRRSPVTSVAAPDPLPVAALVAGVVIALAALLPPAGFAAVVVLVALAVTLDLAGLLEAAAVRPLVLVAVVGAVAAPVTASVQAGTGWEAIPAVVALSVVGTFWLVLLSRRRVGVVEALAATVLALGVAALGGGALVVLHDLPEGARWVGALVVLTVTADVVVGVLAWFRPRTPVAAEIAAPLLAVAGAAALVTTLFDGLVEPLLAARWVLVVVGAAVAGRRLRHHLRTAPADPPPRSAGQLTTGGLTLLLAAPLAYVLAA